jgi:hypothetical protein
MGWFGLAYMAQGGDWWTALANTVTNLRVGYIVGKFLGSCTTAGLLRKDSVH